LHFGFVLALVDMIQLHTYKKTKIVATIGPGSKDKKILASMAHAGLNVARFNMSHGDHESHRETMSAVREVSKEEEIRLAIMLDLSGPKIRIGDFKEESVILKEGSKFTLTTNEIEGDENIVHVNYDRLPKEVKKGSVIMVDDGRKKLVVDSTDDQNVYCEVVEGGKIRSRRGVNIPDEELQIGSLTDKDIDDLAFGVQEGVDFVALSFVRKSEDVLDLKKRLKRLGSDAEVVAKIETVTAVKNIDEIIEVSDAIMIARGDLAIEIGAESVPRIQKNIIKRCNQRGKPVITATQMLESMIKSSTPTRAEVSDVANSIIDGTDAVMLSEETALGKYPVRAVKVMASVAHKTERDLVEEGVSLGYKIKNSVVDSVSTSTVKTAKNVDAKVIIALSETGFTSKMISRHKPEQVIIGFSPHERVCNRMLLSYGCFPVVMGPFQYIADVIDQSRKFITDHELGVKGDRAVITAGVPFGLSGGTNMMFVLIV
jgi:pyruvate kinase